MSLGLGTMSTAGDGMRPLTEKRINNHKSAFRTVNPQVPNPLEF